MIVDEVFDGVRIGGQFNGKPMTVVVFDDRGMEENDTSPRSLAARIVRDHNTGIVLLFKAETQYQADLIYFVQEMQDKRWQVHLDVNGSTNLGKAADLADWVSVRCFTEMPTVAADEVYLNVGDQGAKPELIQALRKQAVWVSPLETGDTKRAVDLALANRRWRVAPTLAGSVLRYARSE